MKGTDDGAPWHSHCGLNEKRAVAAAEELFKVVSEHTAWLFFCFRARGFFCSLRTNCSFLFPTQKLHCCHSVFVELEKNNFL